MSKPMPTKLKLGLLATVAVVLAIGWIKDEVHNHTPQGRYEVCIHRLDSDAHAAGISRSGGDLATECTDKTGYQP